MKKLVLVSAVALGGFVSFAATPVVFHDGIAEDIYEDVYMVQEEYTEVSVDEVPQAVKDALANDFPGAEIAKAHKNEANEYKLEVTMGEETATLYANENGEWIQK
ncbi:PepSY-like domain-containing protein [Robertkochia aurantiaca]|uniref:PepSY-like domain-containing protein n=1 Tax=Robertkochia aurantiaca TaxID=2873700 RepID=UPI001CC9A661|nr:PepSY-like domain-containing protein [Robertkochia sp. 3YJGBD-33]